MFVSFAPFLDSGLPLTWSMAAGRGYREGFAKDAVNPSLGA